MTAKKPGFATHYLRYSTGNLLVIVAGLVSFPILTRLLENTSVGGETREDTGLIGSVASKAGLGGLVPYLKGVKELTMIDDISLETGDGYDDLSLVFGSWLTPRLYVSYGKNMLEESGAFNTRYLLGKGFSIRTETGPLQSGGDLRWEFEH